MNMSELVNFLKQTDIFYQFTPTQLEMVANLCQECAYGKGETVLEERSCAKPIPSLVTG